MTYLTQLRTLLTSARTAEALEQLAAWSQTQSPVWRQAAHILQASWANNEQQANRGLIAYDEAERTRNRIAAGALGLIDEIESGAPLNGNRISNVEKAPENQEQDKKINPLPQTEKTAAPLKGKRINLLATENGRTLKTADEAS